MVEDQFTEKELKNHTYDNSLLRLRLEGNLQNVNTDLKNIEEALGTNVHPLALDLYRIALSVFISDHQLKRPLITESRRFDILISVSNKHKWDAARNKLEVALGSITGETFNFVFVDGKGNDESINQFPTNGQAISLFSGGLDSLAGVVWLLKQKIKPVLVSHLSNSNASRAQKALSSELNRISNQNIEFYQIHARAKKDSGLSQKIRSQMSRSFLYLSIATVFAVGMKISKIFLFENGVMALNIPITTSRIFLNTKTAHPVFLDKFNDLLGILFPVRLEVENPFLEMTKSEVISIIAEQHYRDLVGYSISCSQILQMRFDKVKVSQVSHCGKCYPCILRRVSVYCSGLESNDSRYSVNIADLESIPIDGQKILRELADFFRTLLSYQSDDDVVLEYPYFQIEKRDSEKLIDVYKRYASEFNKFVTERGSAECKGELRIVP